MYHVLERVMPLDVKRYHNKNIGHFDSFPESSVLNDDHHLLDTLYFAKYFKKLYKSSILKLRNSSHYKRTISSWFSTIQNDDAHDLASVANSLKMNVHVHNPLKQNLNVATTQGGGSKRFVNLLKVNKTTYKPIQFFGGEKPTGPLRNIVNSINIFKKRPAPRNVYPVRTAKKNIMYYNLSRVFEVKLTNFQTDGYTANTSVYETLEKDLNIKGEIIVAYLLFRNKICPKGILIKDYQNMQNNTSNFFNSEPNSSSNVICAVELTKCHCFIKNSIIHLNYSKLMQHRDLIIRGIQQNMKNLQRLAFDAVFYEFVNKRYGGDQSLDEEFGAEINDLGTRFKFLAVRENDKGEFSPSKDNMRHVSLLTYVDDSTQQYEQIVLKNALNQMIDENIREEAMTYGIFNSQFPDFSQKFVLSCLGYGKIIDSMISFTNKYGNDIVLPIPILAYAEGFSYITTEYDPEYITLFDYARFEVETSSTELKNKTISDIVLKAFTVLENAKNICKFSHGDANPTNFFLDPEDNIIIYDLEFSSISGNINQFMLDTYDNLYLHLESKKNPVPKVVYDYMWYMDVIRLTMYLSMTNVLTEYQASEDEEADINVQSIKYALETIFDMIPRNSHSEYKSFWHQVMWNGADNVADGTCQLNERQEANIPFISGIIRSHQRKLNILYGYPMTW